MNYAEFRHLVQRAGLQIGDLAEILALKRTSLYHHSSQSQIPRYLAVIAVLVAELAESGQDCRQLLNDIDKWGAADSDANEAGTTDGAGLGSVEGLPAPSISAKAERHKAIFIMNHAEGVGATTLTTTIIDAYAAKGTDLKVFEFARQLSLIYGERVTSLNAVPNYEEVRRGNYEILPRYDVIVNTSMNYDTIADIGSSSSKNVVEWFLKSLTDETLSEMGVDVEIWVPIDRYTYSIECARDIIRSLAGFDFKVVVVYSEASGRMPKKGPVADAVEMWRREGIPCLILENCKSGLWPEIQRKHFSPANILGLTVGETRREVGVGKTVAYCGLSIYQEWIEGWWQDCRNAGVLPR